MADDLNPRAAIAQFFKQELTGTQLLRGIASYNGWRIPARLEGLVPVFNPLDLGAGDCHFFMFSDKEAYQECVEKIGPEIMGEYYIDPVAGHAALSALTGPVTVVNINPYSAEEIHYKPEQLPRLRAWAKIVLAEQALDGVREMKTGYDIIKAFDGYWFIMQDSAYIALAPDGQGRKLAAIFTAEDTLDQFMARNGKPGMKAIPIHGEKLFTALKKMPLDGMVFNCSGPVKPRAFPLAFADAVLRRSGSL